MGLFKTAKTSPSPETVATARPKATPKAKPETTTDDEEPKTASRADLENLSRAVKKKETTVSEKIEAQEFSPVTLEDKKLNDNVKKILEQYSIGSTQWDKAVIGDKAHGEPLIVVCRGEAALSNLFGGKTGFSRTLYKLFGWGRFFGGQDKTLGAKKYTAAYNASHDQSPDGVAGEPLGHLMSGLKSNHYHTIMIFEKDAKTGKYQATPKAVGILDSYQLLLEPFLEFNQKEGGKVLETAKKEYENCFAFDKLIPMQEGLPQIDDLYHSMAEGLSHMQEYSLLTLPLALHKEASVDSDAHNYSQLELFIPAQANNGSWKVLGDKSKLQDKWFKTKEEREAFEAKLEDTPTGITIVRPLTDKKKGLLPSLGLTLTASQIFAGSEARITDEKDKTLIDTVARINAQLIQDYNKEHGLKTSKDSLFDLMIKDSNEGKHLEVGETQPWYKRVFNWGGDTAKALTESDTSDANKETPMESEAKLNEEEHEADSAEAHETEDTDATITAANEDEEAPKKSSSHKTTNAA